MQYSISVLRGLFSPDNEYPSSVFLDYLGEDKLPQNYTQDLILALEKEDGAITEVHFFYIFFIIIIIFIVNLKLRAKLH